MMNWLQRLVGGGKKAEAAKPATTASSTAPKPTRRSVPLTRDYAGPLVAVYPGQVFYDEQTVLLELGKPADITDLPGALLAADPYARFFRSLGYRRNGGAEDAVALTESGSIRAAVAISGGRSFRRPVWWQDLAAAGASVFVVSNTESYSARRIQWNLSNSAVANAPVLIIINDDVAPATQDNPHPEKARLFTATPTPAEFLTGVGLSADLFAGREVRIVFCRFDLPPRPTATPATPAPTSSSKAVKQKPAKQLQLQQEQAAEAEFVVERPAEVVEALEWLASAMVADSFEIVRKQRAAEAEEAEAERKRLADEAAAQTKRAAPALAAAETESTATTSATAA